MLRGFASWSRSRQVDTASLPLQHLSCNGHLVEGADQTNAQHFRKAPGRVGSSSELWRAVPGERSLWHWHKVPSATNRARQGGGHERLHSSRDSAGHLSNIFKTQWIWWIVNKTKMKLMRQIRQPAVYAFRLASQQIVLWKVSRIQRRKTIFHLKLSRVAWSD